MNRALWAAPLALSVALAGCEDMLTETPKNFLTTDSYYGTPGDIESATLAAYQPITRGDVWEWNLVLLTELASDHVRVHPDEPNFGTYLPGLLAWTGTEGPVANPWNGFYTSIFRANLVLDRAPGVTFGDAAHQKQLIAEAKFIRAYSYLKLTKLYGAVPLLLSMEDHTNAAGASRVEVEQVHAQVVKDLTEAIADLPEAPRAHGRASKAAARMVMADLYQWRSSALKKNEWQQMSTYAKQVVDDSRWGLVDDYISQFIPANKVNKEMIWMVASSGLEGRTSTNVFCMWLPRILGFGSAGGCEVLGQPTEWFYNSWTPGDYRFEQMYRTEGCSTNASIGCKQFDWPNVFKYRPTNRGVGGPTDVDFPLYRYAEALLMYAEAQFEMGNHGPALDAINQVRARARKGTGGENRAQPANLTAVTRDAIYMERGWELAHEGKRWFDQVRRDALDPGYFERTLKEHNSDEDVRRMQFSNDKKLLPIPFHEMRVNRNLEQNPGYGRP
jgi:starch-binding outer membrane protein, SusD/RagB family